MEPVVNGLEASYGERGDFRWMDANSDQGGDAFRHYQLPGHPSYVILNTAAEVLWSGLGEQPSEALEQQLRSALAEQ